MRSNTGASKPRGGTRYDDNFVKKAEQATRDAVTKKGAPHRSRG